MIQDELITEAEIRRFLLGEMSEGERSVFEERFVSDNDIFEQIRVVEDDLIESYIRETLLPAEKEKFERNFLTTQPRRERVTFTRSMLDKLAQPKDIAVAKKTETAAANSSVWDLVKIFFKTPSLVFGTALAILLAACGAWFLLRNSNDQEIARQPAPTPTANVEIIQSNSNRLEASNENSSTNSNLKTTGKTEMNTNNTEPKKNSHDRNSNAPKTETIAVNPVLALFSGTVRSEGKTKELNLPKNANSVLLQLNLESQAYKIYLVEIVTPDGAIVSKSGKLKAQNSRINFSVPAQKLQRGDYLVKVSGINPQNEIESAADFSFRIIQK